MVINGLHENLVGKQLNGLLKKVCHTATWRHLMMISLPHWTQNTLDSFRCKEYTRPHWTTFGCLTCQLVTTLPGSFIPFFPSLVLVDIFPDPLPGKASPGTSPLFEWLPVSSPNPFSIPFGTKPCSLRLSGIYGYPLCPRSDPSPSHLTAIHALLVGDAIASSPDLFPCWKKLQLRAMIWLTSHIQHDVYTYTHKDIYIYIDSTYKQIYIYIYLFMVSRFPHKNHPTLWPPAAGGLPHVQAAQAWHPIGHNDDSRPPWVGRLHHRRTHGYIV